MSSTSPSPNSPVAATPPESSSPPPNPLNSSPPTALPPQPNSPPPQPPIVPPPDPPGAPPSQLNSTVPPPPPQPQPQSPPPTTVASPPPMASTPLPPPNAPPPQANAPPPSVPPPPTSPPPASLPPLPSPPPSGPPKSSPPPLTNPPPPRPPNNAPPPPSSPPPRQPPNNSPPPPPPRQPPNNSPPPPPLPPPSPDPPQSSPPPPSTEPPRNSPPLPVVPPPSPAPPVPSRSPPPRNSPPRSSPPPSITTSPPPPSTVPSPPVSPPRPSQDPPGNNTSTNNSSDNAPESSQSPSSGGIGTGGTVAIAVAVSLLLLGIFGIVACCVRKRKKKASGHNVGHVMPASISASPESGSGLLKVRISAPNYGSGSRNGITYSPHEPGGLGNSRSWFTYEELVDATNGFSAQHLLGEGGFGTVYKGNLADGREVAIKQLKSGGGQGEREFRSEVEIISRIHHRHLVSLVGYCISGERRLLVYDYLPNNTLYFHLHGQPVMNWSARVKIAIGAARGIAYLHEDCHPRIIHRDIKSSNILIDANFEARVSDFGLAKLAMDANTHITTRVMGTFGYMAPEYASSGKLTEKSDVYSFGVVLLELITGRKPVDTSQPLGDESLVEWARPLLSHALETEEFGELQDPRLDGNFVSGEMFRLIEAAAACVRHSSTKRPMMGQVVRAFNSMATSDLTNGMKVGESEIVNSAQQSEEIRLFQRMAFGSKEYSTDFFSQNSWSSEGNRGNSRRI